MPCCNMHCVGLLLHVPHAMYATHHTWHTHHTHHTYHTPHTPHTPHTSHTPHTPHTHMTHTHRCMFHICLCTSMHAPSHMTATHYTTKMPTSQHSFNNWRMEVHLVGAADEVASLEDALSPVAAKERFTTLWLPKSSQINQSKQSI